MSEILCLTFKSHQTIIGEIIKNYNKEVYCIKNPVQIISVPPRSANDTGGVGFAPYLAFVEEFDKGIIINKNEFLTINTPVDDLLENYRRMFSKIEIAPAGLKL